MSKGGHYERKKVKKPAGKGKRIALIIACVILVLIIAAIIFGVVYFNAILDQANYVEVPDIVYTEAPTEETTEATENTTESTTEATTVETTAPHVASSEDIVNILLVGQASRMGEQELFADTMILCSINTYTKTLTMTSILRDSFIKMPDYKGHSGGRIKMTTIYHLGNLYGGGVAGSMELTGMTLYSNFGIEVDHFIEVDFDGFIKLVDMMGGLEITITQAEADYMNADDRFVKYDMKEGWNSIDGTAALSYARMRKAEGDGDSDIKRTERQRKVIESLLNKLKRQSLSDMNALANEALSLITTSMSKDEIADMLLTMLPILPELTIETGGTCPVETTYWGDSVDIYSDGMLHSVLRFDEGQNKKLMRAITEGETAE